MSNPAAKFQDNASRNATGTGTKAQVVTDTKFSTKTLAIGVAPPQTDFFTTQPLADPTLDWYDNGNQLVTSGKKFTVQAIGVNVVSTSIADINAVIQLGVLVLFAQQKEIGRMRIRNLTAAGGPFVAGAQVAAASSVGVINGTPANEPWQFIEFELETNQMFKTTLLMPITTPYTIIAATTVEVDLFGFESRPTA